MTLLYLLSAVPLENTCYHKTLAVTSWAEARRQCWDWGGDLAFPLTSNMSTPRSWQQVMCDSRHILIFATLLTVLILTKTINMSIFQFIL